MTKASQWSNAVPRDADEDIRRPTAEELRLEGLAEKNKGVKATSFDVTSKNLRALRVIYDFDGHALTIQPGQTRHGVSLHPATAAYLSREGSDLALSPSKGG